LQNKICPRIDEFLCKCKYPYLIKHKNLYLHPEDYNGFHRLVHFLPASEAAKVFPDHMLPKGIKGFLLGYSVFIQDDITIIMLAMNGGKSIKGGIEY